MFIFASLLLYPGIHAILLFPKISHLSGMTGMDWEKGMRKNPGKRKTLRLSFSRLLYPK